MTVAPAPAATQAPTEAATEPQPAERARSVLAVADSLVLTTGRYVARLSGPHRIGPDGHLRLDVPADSAVAQALAEERARTSLGDLPATVEVTDVAPVAVPERVRSRVALAGWLTTAAHRRPVTPVCTLVLRTVHVALEEGEHTTLVDTAELARATPDPLARVEAEHLTHLESAHPEVIEWLTRLIDVAHLQGVVRVHPLRLDRYGLTFRLQRARTHRDVRIPFPTPLRRVDQVAGALQFLLAEAHTAQTCPRSAPLSPPT